jgi:hypothetical protein
MVYEVGKGLLRGTHRRAAAVVLSGILIGRDSYLLTRILKEI